MYLYVKISSVEAKWKSRIRHIAFIIIQWLNFSIPPSLLFSLPHWIARAQRMEASHVHYTKGIRVFPRWRHDRQPTNHMKVTLIGNSSVLVAVPEHYLIYPHLIRDLNLELEASPLAWIFIVEWVEGLQGAAVISGRHHRKPLPPIATSCHHLWHHHHIHYSPGSDTLCFT